MNYKQPVWKIIKRFFFAVTCLICSISTTYAGLITSDISITNTSITFDTSSSFGATTGDFTVVEGGSATINEFADDTVTTGVNPLLGTLTHTGDGVGFSGDVDVTDDTYLIGFDSALDIANTSLTDIYKVILKLTYSNLVNAIGADAYADSEFVLWADGSELFFSDLISDTVNGNEIDGVLGTGFGGELTDAATLFFEVILNPTDILELELTWTLEGGEYDTTGQSIAKFSQFLSIETVALQSPPQAVPAPASLLLFAIGLLGVRRKNTFFKTK